MKTSKRWLTVLMTITLLIPVSWVTLGSVGSAIANPLLYTPSLLAHWKLDEGQGLTFHDSSSVGNHLTLNQPADWQEGYLGSHSVLFAEQVRASTSSLKKTADINQSQAFSFSFRIKPRTSNNMKMIASIGGVIGVSIGSNESVHLDLFGTYHNSGQVLNFNRWNHVALTLSGKKLIIYVNGNERSRRTFDTDKTLNASGYVSIGGVWAHDTPNQLDDLRLYSQALTAPQVKQLAQQFQKETTPPSSPENLKLMGKNNTAGNLEWLPSTDNIDIKGYRIYVNGEQRLFTTNTSATVTGLYPDAAYQVEVRAEDLSGNLSAASVPVRFMTDSQYLKSQGMIGINLEGVCDYCREEMFVDLFKSARPWMNWNYPTYAFDKDHYGNIRSLEPGREAFTLMGIARQGTFRKGIYIVRYDGEGDLDFWQHGGSKLLEEQPGYMKVDAQSDGIWFTLKAVNPDNYIRNIRVIHEDDQQLAQTHTFQPDFIDRWNDFPVTRFMHTMKTNNTKIVDWADRSTPQDFSQSGDSETHPGMAIEYLVQLANELDSDPWFNMPTMANDDYIRQFATYVRDHLDPNANIHVEYSNETWNSIFFQYNVCVAEGKKLGYTGSDLEISAKYHAYRAKQVFQIWEEVFGGSQRLINVIGGFQAGGGHYANLILSHEDVHEMADAYATAPYFAHDYGGFRAEWVKTATPAEIFADLEHEIEISNKQTRQVVDAVSSFGLDTVAYEGGQHMAPIFVWQTGIFYQNDDLLVNKLAWMNRQPQMYQLYQKHFDGWKAAGGKLNVTFTSTADYGRYGSFGLLEYANQPLAISYKYRSTLDWLKSHPPWWQESGAVASLPESPRSVSATNVRMNTLNLTWTAPLAGANGTVTEYEVTVDGVSRERTDGTSYSLTGLQPNRKYLIGVKAHFADGTASGRRYVEVQTLRDTTAPSVPTGLTVSDIQMEQLRLSWNASTDNVGLRHYEVLLNGKVHAQVTGMTHLLTGLKAGTGYSLAVRAVDSHSNRSVSSARLAVRTAPDTQSPTAPAQVYSTVVTQTTVQLHWTPASDNRGVTAYEVYRGDTLLATVKGTEYVVSGLTKSSWNSFTVRALDAAGNRSAPSPALSRATLNDTLAPSTPQNVRMRAVTANSVTLAWDAAFDNVGIARYEILRDGHWLMDSDQPTATMTGLTAATDYSFTVLAVDTNGLKSAAGSVIQATTLPAEVSNLPQVNISRVQHVARTQTATLSVSLATPARLTLRLLGADGNVLTTPMNGVAYTAGNKGLTFRTTSLTSGDYVYELRATATGTPADGPHSMLRGRLAVDQQKPVISEASSNGSITHESHRRVTAISFQLSETAMVRAVVTDEQGKAVRVLADGVRMFAGTHSLLWNGTSTTRQMLPDGLYTIRLSATDVAGLAADSVVVPVRIDTSLPLITVLKRNVDVLRVNGKNQFILQYALSEDASVEINVFNPYNQHLGKFSTDSLKKGVQMFRWDGKWNNKFPVNGGQYYLTFQAKDAVNKNAVEQRVYIRMMTEF